MFRLALHMENESLTERTSTAISWYSFDKNLKVANHDVVSEDEAFRVIDDYLAGLKPHYDSGEEAVMLSVFGLSKSPWEYIEIAFNSESDIDFRLETKVSRKAVERRLHSKEELKALVSAFYEMDPEEYLAEVRRVVSCKAPTPPRKFPGALLVVPFAMAFTGTSCYFLVLLAVRFAAFFREETGGFSIYAEKTKTLIVVPMLLASIPIGIIVTILFAWGISPVLQYLDRNSFDFTGTDFWPFMKGLMVFTMCVAIPLILISLAAALWGS